MEQKLTLLVIGYIQDNLVSMKSMIKDAYHEASCFGFAGFTCRWWMDSLPQNSSRPKNPTCLLLPLQPMP